MKALANITILQLSFLTLLIFITLSAAALRHLLPYAAFALLPVIYHVITRPRPILLLNYACYKPSPHRKCSSAAVESFLRRNAHLSPEALSFTQTICQNSGLGEETYVAPFILEEGGVPKLKCAVQEAGEGIFFAVDALLAKTLVDPLSIDVVIVTCGTFSPTPSLSSLVVNRYKLKADVKTYNLSGMGCSSGVISIDFAARVLRGSRKVQTALVVINESVTMNWYKGENRSMIVTNCLFRVGCAAAMLTNDPSLRRVAKMELVDSLRTHHGAEEAAYRVGIQEEDDKGITGFSLSKDLSKVAAFYLGHHIKILAPRVMSLSQLAYSLIASAMTGLTGKPVEPVAPDFKRSFEHMCIHTGGKAIIEEVARVLRLGDEVTEPARMTLNRFGNTSGSLVFYELSYFEAKKRTKKGDKMWMVAFGTGFKFGSLIWVWLQDSNQDLDNPWMDCIHNYPLKAW